MATISEQLNKLASTKAAIKTAIKNKGVSVADTDTFASYADKIGSIETKKGNFVQPTAMGVYAIKADKSVITQTAFNALSDTEKKKCIGVYVKSNYIELVKEFCLRKQTVPSNVTFQWSSTNVKLSGMSSFYEGKEDTAIINAAYPTEANAANFCLACGGYLPSSFELKYLFNDLTTINALLSGMNGIQIYAADYDGSGNNWVWTSTQVSDMYAKQVNCDANDRTATKTNLNGKVIPIFTIEQV